MATRTRNAKSVSIAEAAELTRAKEYVPAGGEDVGPLQTYLERFGYVEPAREGERRLTPTMEPGTFDAATEEALRRFQEFNSLEVTGELDQATLDLMSRPRCGFPDFFAEFSLQGSKWNQNNLTYAYQNFTPDLTQAQIRTAISQAFNLWAAVTPLSFTEVGLGSSPDIIIRFVAGDHGDGYPFDGSSGVLAHAFYPPPGGGSFPGDTHFDEAELWTVSTPPSGFDLVTVAAHEFGHALGLAHSNVNGALMYAYYGGAHRNLEADDVAGIQAVYGPKSKWLGWEKLGGALTSGIGVSSWAANRLDCFVRGTDNAMWHKWWNGSKWLGWEKLGGALTSGIGVSSWAANRLDCFVRGTDNAMWHKWWNGSKWLGWEKLGGGLSSAPAAVSWGPNRIDTFVRGMDNALWHKWWNGSTWSGWESLGGVLSSAPAVSSWAANRLDVFVRGSDNAMWHKWWNGSTWSGWESLGGVLTSEPGAVSWGPSRIDTFVRGTDNAMWHKWYQG
jgi:peptidoglycan hydrolase-like protein with peptidoglycan-binding domain